MPHGRAKGLRQRGRLTIYTHQSDTLCPGIPKLEQAPSVGPEVLLRGKTSRWHQSLSLRLWKTVVGLQGVLGVLVFSINF